MKDGGEEREIEREIRKVRWVGVRERGSEIMKNRDGKQGKGRLKVGKRK